MLLSDGGELGSEKVAISGEPADAQGASPLTSETHRKILVIAAEAVAVLISFRSYSVFGEPESFSSLLQLLMIFFRVFFDIAPGKVLPSHT